MTESKPGFFAQLKSFPPTFYVANTMEIFERMAWYGFFAVSSLYITGPVETGALGFTSEQRGQLQAIVPFILYLMPVVTGALADRYGYKRMFIIAYTGMVCFYYLLGQFKTFPTFLMAFLLVAVSAAIFKPVVVGTVGRVTNASNSRLGFGIFYMMVNVGGFFGPLIAGAVRGLSWKYVFISCSVWAAVNLVIVSIFYKEPTTEAGSANKRTIGKVLTNAVEVLGNLRFFITVFVVLVALMVANQEPKWFQWWPHCVVFIAAWIILNFVWDALMPAHSGNPSHPASAGRGPFAKRMYCSNWRFALYLLILSGFWTSFNQIFLTTPEYIRDFTDTKPMVNAGRKVAGWFNSPRILDALAAVEEPEFMEEFDKLVRRAHGVPKMTPPEVPTASSNANAKSKAKAKLEAIVKNKKYPENDRLQAEAAIKALDASSDATSQPTTAPSTAEIARATEALLRTLGDKSPDRADKNWAVEEETKELVKQFAQHDKVKAASDSADQIERSKRTRELPEDPSVKAEDRAELERLASRLNTATVKEPFVAVDFVDAARTILQYKVRITPVELAHLVAAVPAQMPTVADATLDTALKTINKRLELKGRTEVRNADATAVRTRLRELVTAHGTLVPLAAVAQASEALSTSERKIDPEILATGVRDLAYRPTVDERMDSGRQVNPEHIVNFDALAIVLLQVIVSFFMSKFHQFTTMIVGMVIAAIGIGLAAFSGGTMIGPVGGSLLIVAAGVVIFAVGEMMASPTSQEYVSRIAPPDRVAVYMGYYFVSVALGNLFGGILSGQLYGKLARDMQRPDLMWLAFGGIMFATAVLFILYDRFAVPKASRNAAGVAAH